MPTFHFPFSMIDRYAVCKFDFSNWWIIELVEHELWQREEKGLIGILPIQDAAEVATVDSVLSQAWCIQFLYSLSRLVHVFQLDKETVDGSNPFILAGQAAPLLAESPSSPAYTLVNKT